VSIRPPLQRRLALAVASLLVLAAATVSAAVAQPGVVFGEPQARGDFGEPIVFGTSFRSSTPPQRVELLTALPHDTGHRVSLASVQQTGPDTWAASVAQGGHVVPNTSYRYRFRVVGEDGATLGPEGSHRVVDTRLEWQQLSGDHVTVWWHAGDQAFAERALAIAEDAVMEASELLGVHDIEPIDFFIYGDSRAFRQAMGPATRENVGGQAYPHLRTLFGLIEPRQVASDWVEELVVHELAHMIFDEAVRNPYGYPPRWLNEGLAVYLTRGYDAGDRAQVEGAARTGSIIPLEGLAGQFPTRALRFGLAYAESVSAIDFLVETYGQATLVELITSFADGRTVDEAFLAATGASFLAFEDAWLASVGAERPEPFGPRPAEPAASAAALPDAEAATPAALLR
jgi:hypothetical protein